MKKECKHYRPVNGYMEEKPSGISFRLSEGLERRLYHKVASFSTLRAYPNYYSLPTVMLNGVKHLDRELPCVAQILRLRLRPVLE